MNAFGCSVSTRLVRRGERSTLAAWIHEPAAFAVRREPTWSRPCLRREPIRAGTRCRNVIADGMPPGWVSRCWASRAVRVAGSAYTGLFEAAPLGRAKVHLWVVLLAWGARADVSREVSQRAGVGTERPPIGFERAKPQSRGVRDRRGNPDVLIVGSRAEAGAWIHAIAARCRPVACAWADDRFHAERGSEPRSGCTQGPGVAVPRPARSRARPRYAKIWSPCRA